MPQDVEFLFDNALVLGVEDLIKNAKSNLLLVCPYIDFDPRISAALQEKKNLPGCHLRVLFGKNDHTYLKSIKAKSLSFLKEFPSIDIRYNERLHAKYYQNECEYIASSMNLYNFSLSHNIEFGVKSQYRLRGFVGKLADNAAELVVQGIEKIKTEVFSQKAETDPVEVFEKYFETSKKMFKTVPVMSKRTGIPGVFNYKHISAMQIEYDHFIQAENEQQHADATIDDYKATRLCVKESLTKYLSGSALSKRFSCSLKDVIVFMESKGLILNNKITEYGRAAGLTEKIYNNNSYIAYPENLKELAAFSKSNAVMQ